MGSSRYQARADARGRTRPLGRPRHHTCPHVPTHPSNLTSPHFLSTLCVSGHCPDNSWTLSGQFLDKYVRDSLGLHTHFLPPSRACDSAGSDPLPSARTQVRYIGKSPVPAACALPCPNSHCKHNHAVVFAARPSQVNWSPLVSLGLPWSPHTEKMGDHMGWRPFVVEVAPLQTCPAPSFDPAGTTIHPRGSQKTATPPLLRAACIVWYALTAKCMHAILQRYLGLPWQQPPEQQPPDLWDALGIAANAVGRALATAVMQLLGASVVLQERACEHVFGVGTADVAEQLGDAAYLTVLLIIFRRHCSKAPATLPSTNWVSCSWLPRCVHRMHT